MDWEKKITDLFKNLDNLIPLLVFAAMILGPIIKAVLKNKREQKSGGAPRPQEPEQEETPSWWEEEPKAEPASPPQMIPPPSPAPVAAMQETEIPIERASEDVVEEAASVAYGAESVSAFSREEKFVPTTASALGASVSKAGPASPSFESALDRLSPLEAALVLGSALDRPVAFSEPTWARF